MTGTPAGRVPGTSDPRSKDLLRHAVMEATPVQQLVLLRLASLTIGRPLDLPPHIHPRWILLGSPQTVSHWGHVHGPPGRREARSIDSSVDVHRHLFGVDPEQLVFIELHGALDSVVREVARLRGRQFAGRNPGPWAYWDRVYGYTRVHS